MPPIAWYSSFIFLGFSVCVGILIYMIMSNRRKKKEKEQLEKKQLPPELAELKERTLKKIETLEELEKQYKKKG